MSNFFEQSGLPGSKSKVEETKNDMRQYPGNKRIFVFLSPFAKKLQMATGN